MDSIATPVGTITVNRARISDFNCVLAILDSAAGWLTSKGINQWQVGNWPHERIKERIDRGETYLAKLSDRIVGTITLQWSDEFYWPTSSSNDAGYVHALAVADDFHGLQIGLQLLHWAERKIAESGRRYVRLNCMADNQAICRYYEQAGFSYRGEVQDPRWRARLYEKKLSPFDCKS